MKRAATIQLTESDYAGTFWVHAQPKPRFLILAGVLSVVGWLVWQAGPPWLKFPALLVSVVAVSLLVTRPLTALTTAAWHARRQFRQTKGAGDPMDLTWDDDALSIRAPTWNLTSAWTDFLKWREGKDHYLLYLNSALFRIVPKRAFADDAARLDFERLMRDKIKAA